MFAFYAQLFTIFILNTAVLGFLVWAYYSPRYAAHRIDTTFVMKVALRERLRLMVQSSLISLAAVLGLTYFAHDHLFHHRSMSMLSVFLQGSAILLVYDFAYYFMHRSMHHKKVMRFVHGVHHRARAPSALESFFLHPAELLGGLFLLFGSTWLLGPVHHHAFLFAFFVYSMLNILIHSGLDFRHPALAPIDFLTRKHHVHHFDDFSKNYSSLTPLPDLIFGSAG